MASKKNENSLEEKESFLATIKVIFYVTQGSKVYILDQNGYRIEALFSLLNLLNKNNEEAVKVVDHFISLANLSEKINPFLFQRSFDDPFWNSMKYSGAWGEILEMYFTAIEKARQLSKEYKVDIVILETTAEYRDIATIEKSALNRVFFISKEDVDLTADLTEHLLKYIRVKEKTLINSANKMRSKKADTNALQLVDKINEIEGEYQKTHSGKKPPLSTLASLLNERKINAPNGGEWFAQTVKRVIHRAETLQND